MIEPESTKQACEFCANRGIVENRRRTRFDAITYRWCHCLHARGVQAVHGLDYVQRLNLDEERRRKQSERWYELCSTHRRVRPHIVFYRLSTEFAVTDSLDRRDEILGEIEQRLHRLAVTTGNTTTVQTEQLPPGEPTPSPAISHIEPDDATSDPADTEAAAASDHAGHQFGKELVARHSGATSLPPESRR